MNGWAFARKGRLALLVASVLLVPLVSSMALALEQSTIVTEEELLAALGSDDSIERSYGLRHLRRLGPSHLGLVTSLLEHEHHDVRRVAFAVLGDIGDERAKEILRTSLVDTAHVRRDWHALGQALLVARDTDALPLLLELAESHPSEYVRWGFRKTAEQIEAATWGKPPLTVDCGVVRCNFLLDDVQCMCVRNQLWGFVRIIPDFYYREVFAELSSTEEPPHRGMHITAGYLHIELSDDRVAEIEINTDDEFSVGGHSFVSARLASIVGDPDVPPALFRSIRRCSELSARESSN